MTTHDLPHLPLAPNQHLRENLFHFVASNN